jgi:hypothetical protein
VAWDLAVIQRALDNGEVDAITGGSIDGVTDLFEGLGQIRSVLYCISKRVEVMGG